jgi:hypothetical protein
MGPTLSFNTSKHTYLENIDGKPVSEEQIPEMSRKACMLWRTLHEEYYTPNPSVHPEDSWTMTWWWLH